MDSFRIKVFRVLASTLNLSRAGEDLCLSRQCLTQHVKALEEELGTPLFARKGHGIAMTAGGQALLAYAEKIESLCGIAQSAVSDASGIHQKILTLGVATTISQYLFPRLVAEFSVKSPSVSVRATSGNTDSVIEALRDRRIDLALIEQPTEHREIHVETFLLEKMALAVPAGHAWADQQIEVSDLRGEPFLIREAGSGARRAMESSLSRVGLSLADLSIVMELDSTEGLLSAVEAGLGVAILSRRAIQNRLGPEGVKIARVRGVRLVSRFLIANRAWEIPTSEVTAFRSFLLLDSRGLMESNVYFFPRKSQEQVVDNILPIQLSGLQGR